MKKYFSALLALCMAAALAGCMCETVEVSVNSAGGGTVRATFGYSERFVNACDLQDEMQQQGFTRFTLDGKAYYGDTAEETFASPAALNDYFADTAAKMAERGSELNMGTLTLAAADGALTLTLVCDENTGSADAMERTLKKAGRLSGSEITALRDDLVMRYNFTFPTDVYQTSGKADGVTLNGGRLELDLTKLGAGAYEFTTAAQGAELPATGTVYARTQSITIDGKAVTFQTYATVTPDPVVGTRETNYIRLRDLAYAMNGTAAQFSVAWDGSVQIVPHSAYTPNGSEMNAPFTGERTYTKASAATKVNGQSVPLSAFCLTDEHSGSYTYYKLRDLGQVLGFDVSWRESRGIFIDTSKPYTAD